MKDLIQRRDFMTGTVAGAALAATAASIPAVNAAQTPDDRKLNVLFIMTDQQRYDCLGANGNPIIQTPNLDRLAAQSANFSNFFVQSPVCVPSRASFFTGRYAHAHRNRVNYTPLNESEVLMPARLQSSGYRTALIGKTHLYYQFPPTPEEAKRTGYDVVELHDGSKISDPWSDYVKWRQSHDPQKDIYYRKTVRGGTGGNPYRAVIDEHYSDITWTGERTCHWLRQLAEADQPFFLFSSFFKPHSPFEVSEPFDAMYSDVDIPLPRQESLEDIQRLPLPLQKLILRGGKPPYNMERERLEWCYRSYYGAISHIDREVGHILDTLAKSGAAENTIVVFTSDHGDQLLEHGFMGKNAFFEASIHVPFMIRLPGRVKTGRYDELTESVDLLPTLFDLLDLPEPYHCHGKSLAPLITDCGTAYEPRNAVFSENIIPEVITSGKLDFQFEKGKGVKGIRHPDAKMVRTRRWKYNYYPEGFEELYDLRSDPLEQQNLASRPEFQSVVREMKGRILDWLITTTETEQIAPRWMIP
ncbi:MAG: sulfatase-like hydrolase/transferase [Candidatus Pacebacteria bacterium]|nr:sulfatase-like hydrolase/transferase [Candidatus Paceibacterota bacterium]